MTRGGTKKEVLAGMAKRMHGMEKIVIISSQLDKSLIVLLNIVFPDCEIRVASSRAEALEEALTTAEALRDRAQSLSDIKPLEGV